MKNHIVKIYTLIIGITISIFLFSSSVFALESEAIENEIIESKIIADFDELDKSYREFIINKADKPDLETFLDALPKTLNVYLDNENIVQTIDVTWYCVGEDYNDPDAYYFQFSPKWDSEKYVLAQAMDSVIDVPYISVFFTDETVTEGAAVTSSKNETIIFEFLVKEVGFNTAGACGVLANIYHESGFNPNAMGDSGTSYGICQWHNSRWTAMKKWCDENNYDWKTLIGQLNYLKFELSKNDNAYLWNGKTIYNKIIAVENSAQGAYDAAYNWCYYFEVPANKATVSKTRGNLAKNTYWPEYKDVKVDMTPETKPETDSDTKPETQPIPLPIPGPVENLSAVSSGKQRVTLSWNAAPGATGYLVYGQKNGKYGYVGMTSGTKYTDMKALDTQYNFYWVFPYVTVSTGKMIPGGCTKYVYAKGVCPAVTDLKASSVTGGVKMTWTASAGADGYLVYGIVNGGAYGYVGMTNGTAYTDKKASDSVYNYYWVFPYHKDANGKMITGGVAQYVYGRSK